jgi:hypothetical protein
MLKQESRYGGVIRPSIKLTVSLVMLATVYFVAINVLQLIPAYSFTVNTLTQAGAGTIAIVLMLFFGQQVAVGIRNIWKANPELFDIAFCLIQVLVVAIAYISFHKVIDLVFSGWSWAYVVALFAIALVPGIKAGITVINSIDKWFESKSHV